MALSKEELNRIFNNAWDAKIDGDYETAKELFQRIISKVNPKFAYEYVDSFNGLGNVAFDEGLLSKAKEYYQKGVDLISKYCGKNWKKKRMEWGIIENRPYLRAIHGLCLCEWRDKNFKEAEDLASLLLKICPNDNLGVRFIIDEIKSHKKWSPNG